MTANYTEACFQAHKRFRSSAILFLFLFFFAFFTLSLYILNAFVCARTHTQSVWIEVAFM